MIIVQLKGGLGNQLFQYAAGFSLALHKKCQLKVDCNYLGKDVVVGSLRELELKNFKIEVEIASQDEINFFFNKDTLLQKLIPPYKRFVYKEANFTYDTKFFESRESLYLKGYRQSEKYFSICKNNLLSKLQIKEEIGLDYLSLSKEFKKDKSVALHVRRGDYLQKEALRFHGVLDASYYNSALKKINSKIENPTLYVFSDDINWVKQNLHLPKNVMYVTNEMSKTAISDFHLISSCKHQIIANSTFSWWAAYLNPNPNKIVIAPKKWFNNAPYDTRDLFPPDWILM